MSAELRDLLAALLVLAAAAGLGAALLRALGADARVRAAAGGSSGVIWLGCAAASILFELSTWLVPDCFGSTAYAVAALGLVLGLWELLGLRRSRGAVHAPRRELALASLALVGPIALALAASGGALAGVDALEVYALKARALHEGTLEELAPRCLGASHPLLVSHVVAWHAAFAGSVSPAAQIGFAALAWGVAARCASALYARSAPPRFAGAAVLVFACSPPLLALVPRGEADLPLLAGVLGAASTWCVGGRARAVAVLFAASAAAAKNEGLAWIALLAAARWLGLGRGSEACSEPRAHHRAAGSATLALLALLLLRLPAALCRARWGTFVEHLDGAAIAVLLDPGYLAARGAIVLEELGRAGCGPESAFAAPLWALALAFAGRSRAAAAPLFLGAAWLAFVVLGMLIGTYAARWQAEVAAARVWLQASPWLVAALLAVASPSRGERGRVAREPRSARSFTPSEPPQRSAAHRIERNGVEGK